VDCAADHRHAPGWVYGQPEWNREALVGATRVAAPGCFATAVTLALAPLVAAGVALVAAWVTAATGSTGSGATPSSGTHHPERFTNLRAYKVLRHQHVPEVRRCLAGLGAAPDLHLVPLSAPVDRGILASVLVQVGDVDAAALFADAYAGAPLVRLRSDSPELRWVRGTALADVSVHQDGDVAAVLVAIDNLGKGAAAQAVQALNLALGWPETAGLHTPAVTP
jgi:N-acetyl-gamma-glutamyl-phosphate reductase